MAAATATPTAPAAAAASWGICAAAPATSNPRGRLIVVI